MLTVKKKHHLQPPSCLRMMTTQICVCSLQGNDDDSEEEAPAAAPELFEDDGNTDLCVLCGLGGSLLCCDGCPAAYHMRCIGETAKSIPEGEWLCPECSVGGRGKM